MRNFWGFYQNESFSVGCNGATVYVFDATGKQELARFKDFPYAYRAAFKPGSNVIAVKSTAGYLGFYDLDSLALIQKVTVTKIGAQDEGFAFTPDGKYFLNIEKPVSSLYTQLSIYESNTFAKERTLFADERKMALDYLEFDNDTGTAYVLGFMRKDYSGVFERGFVGQLDVENEAVINLHELERTRYFYLVAYKNWEQTGFTKKAFRGTVVNDAIPTEPITLKKILYWANKQS